MQTAMATYGAIARAVREHTPLPHKYLGPPQHRQQQGGRQRYGPTSGDEYTTIIPEINAVFYKCEHCEALYTRIV